jgi:hypothetical protein
VHGGHHACGRGRRRNRDAGCQGPQRRSVRWSTCTPAGLRPVAPSCNRREPRRAFDGSASPRDHGARRTTARRGWLEAQVPIELPEGRQKLASGSRD